MEQSLVCVCWFYSVVRDAEMQLPSCSSSSLSPPPLPSPLLLLSPPLSLHLFQEQVWIRFLQINGDLGPQRLRYHCQY